LYDVFAMRSASIRDNPVASAPIVPATVRPRTSANDGMDGLGADSIFQQSWWLDAAAPGTWQRVETYWDKTLVGSMSFAVSARAGIRYVQLPPLTRMLSPRLRPPASHPTRRLTNNVKILESLLKQLPRHERFELCLKPHCEATLPFVMLNYAVAHTYTFVLPCLGNVGANIHQKTRNVLIKSARLFQVQSGDLDRFLKLLHMQHSSRTRIDSPALHRLYEAARSRGQLDVLCAVNARSDDAACAILIWDDQVLYHWLSTRDPQPWANGASSLLILQAMEKATHLGLTFDIDSYGSPSAAPFVAKFGLAPAVRPYVNNSSPLWKLLHFISSLRGGRHDRHYRF
jgi:hypothetical protein